MQGKRIKYNIWEVIGVKKYEDTCKAFIRLHIKDGRLC
ncbi:putative membrane domain protein [Bacteroides fragilis str. S38L5]|nr:putative membrane domain protein [Bacteroides fragilis str. S38L5]EYB13552.1 putative membrane domain protein [Bacteroides fragilis str. S38L3]